MHTVLDMALPVRVYVVNYTAVIDGNELHASDDGGTIGCSLELVFALPERFEYLISSSVQPKMVFVRGCED